MNNKEAYMRNRLRFCMRILHGKCFLAIISFQNWEFDEVATLLALLEGGWYAAGEMDSQCWKIRGVGDFL